MSYVISALLFIITVGQIFVGVNVVFRVFVIGFGIDNTEMQVVSG